MIVVDKDKLGAFGLGYPAVRFRNKVEGKTLSIQWNGG